MAFERDQVEDGVTWWPAAHGERQAIRVDSRATAGAYRVRSLRTWSRTRHRKSSASSSRMYGCEIFGPPGV